MLLGQRHRERLALDDAVEAELLALVRRLYADYGAQLLNDVFHHSGGLGVDDALRAARQPLVTVNSQTSVYILTREGQSVLKNAKSKFTASVF